MLCLVLCERYVGSYRRTRCSLYGHAVLANVGTPSGGAVVVYVDELQRYIRYMHVLQLFLPVDTVGMIYCMCRQEYRHWYWYGYIG